MRSMRLGTVTGVLAATLTLSACTLMQPSPSFPHPAPPAAGSPSGSAQPAPATPAPETPGTLTAPPERPPAPVPRQFHLSAASGALVSQAHAQAGSGDPVAAAATLERALRIEPENPLLWIELGRVRLNANNPSQADAMGRKALSLATGDPAAQASAWRLIADSLRARGRNGEAAEAESHAEHLAAAR